MTRVIKRYGSRKLYDTLESRYILLEDIAEFVREGQEIQVIDNKTQEDVTGQTLTQVISEEGRKKSDFLSSELLHDLIRAGESAVTHRVRQLQDGMEHFMKKSIDRLVPLRTVRDEMAHLRNRLEELEVAVQRAEAQTVRPPESQTEEIAAASEHASAQDDDASEKQPVPAKAPRKSAAKSKKAPATAGDQASTANAE